MAATELGQQLEIAYGQYTERFGHVMSLKMFSLLATQYNPTNPTLVLGNLWALFQRLESAYDSSTEKFYKAFRAAETGQYDAPVYASNRFPYYAFVRGFMIAGPQAIKRKEALLGKSFANFTPFEKQQSMSYIVGDMSYKVYSAPRQNMIDTIKADPRTDAFMRVTDSGACNFCRMLASRGPVYKESTSRFRAHSNCNCSAVPMYKGYKQPQSVTDGTREWLEQMKDRETKLRRQEAAQVGVDAGMLKPKTITVEGKDGVSYDRRVYVKTEAAKIAEQVNKPSVEKVVDKYERGDEPFLEPEMSDRRKKEVKEQSMTVLKQSFKDFGG